MNEHHAELTVAVFDDLWPSIDAIDAARLGIRIIEIPAPSIDALDLAHTRLGQTDWVVFADPFAAARYVSNANRRDELETVRVCAAGERVVEILRRSNVHSDSIPQRIASEAIVETILDYEATIDDVRILLVATAGIFSDLESLFAGESAICQRYDVCHARFRDAPGTANARRLILGGAVDGLFADGPDDLFRLSFLLGGSVEPLHGLGFEVLSRDPMLMRTAIEFGFSFGHFPK